MACKNSIAQLADELLERIENDELVKSANLSYIRNDKLKTQLGQQMLKVAEDVREAAKDNQISYADLHKFREHYGV